MNNDRRETKVILSKFLSLVLRHKPETIGLELSNDGWTDTKILIQKMNEYGQNIDMKTLYLIVNTNSKKRFGFNDDFSKIRAHQGHSIELDLGLIPKIPPEFLYHGTAKKSVENIKKTGIDKRQRHYVHLSKEFDTAKNVGQRHGKPMVLRILSGQMHEDGFTFFQSENKVWLADHVPIKYICYESECPK